MTKIIQLARNLVMPNLPRNFHATFINWAPLRLLTHGDRGWTNLGLRITVGMHALDEADMPR